MARREQAAEPEHASVRPNRKASLHELHLPPVSFSAQSLLPRCGSRPRGMCAKQIATIDHQEWIQRRGRVERLTRFSSCAFEAVDHAVKNRLPCRSRAEQHDDDTARMSIMKPWTPSVRMSAWAPPRTT